MLLVKCKCKFTTGSLRRLREVAHVLPAEDLREHEVVVGGERQVLVHQSSQSPRRRLIELLHPYDSIFIFTIVLHLCRC